MSHSKSTSNFNFNTMEPQQQPFEAMAKEGVPKAEEPTGVAKPEREEQNLPKLSPQDFRVYNRMAEHMDMFVSSCLILLESSGRVAGGGMGREGSTVG